jgi:hypothetical protein
MVCLTVALALFSVYSHLRYNFSTRGKWSGVAKVVEDGQGWPARRAQKAQAWRAQVKLQEVHGHPLP